MKKQLSVSVAVLLLAGLTQIEASRRAFGTYSSIGFRNSPALTGRSNRGPSSAHNALAFLDDGGSSISAVSEVAIPLLAKNLIRGAVLRVASDLSGGTPLESIKCRVTGTKDGPLKATRDIIREGGLQNLWTGTPSRTVEGALMGAIFMLGSTLTKKQMILLGASKTTAALAGGLVGGVAQSIVMTPAAMVFTSLNLNRGKKGYENDNALTVAQRIIKEKGIGGMFIGAGPMATRQASNWASRSCLTEIARTTFRMSEFGMLGEFGSGVLGGLGSSWNTPIETIRVLMQSDVGSGRKPKTSRQYWDMIVADQGYVGLFRGVTPRAIQAVWQTLFLVVVPNLIGI